jgi:predicted nucleotide-binding protein (sugar kinase/HSP70/actin superfamily)
MKHSQNKSGIDNKTVDKKNRENGRVALSLLGHPYMIYYSCLNMRHIEKINKRNINIEIKQIFGFRGVM